MRDTLIMETKIMWILRDEDGFELGAYCDEMSAFDGFYGLSLKEAQIERPDGSRLPLIKIKNGTAIATVRR
jgi:hypothetical protein